MLDSRNDVMEFVRPVRKTTDSLEVNIQKKIIAEKAEKAMKSIDNGPVSRRSSV